jgi:zinc transporter ZupT
MSSKPQCGGGAANLDDYDLPLHIAAVFLVFTFSIGGAGLPVVGKRVPWCKLPPGVLFFCKHFGTGVLVATAFVHLIPTAFDSLSDPCLPSILTDDYPAMPGVIMMAALFALFTIEMYLKGKTGGHSHGGPMGHGTPGLALQGARPGVSTPLSLPEYAAHPRDNNLDYDGLEKPHAYTHSYEVKASAREEMEQYNNLTDMPTWFQVFYAQYVRQREELKEMVMAVTPREILPPAERSAFDASSDVDPSDTESVADEGLLKRMNLNITLLEGGILFHSVFVGMTVSITTDGFVVLLIAILFHQFFEGLGLGSRIAAVPYPKSSIRPWVLVTAFGTTCPIGQAIGLLTRNSYDPSSAFALILVGAFNAL